MKPALGRIVYVIFKESIIQETVFAHAKDGFIADSVNDPTVLESYRTTVYLYEDYNNTWFTSFDKAKKAILNQYTEPVKLEQLYHDYWEIRNK